MVLHHKAKSFGLDVKGFLVKEGNDYYIIEEDTNKYLVQEETIMPCFEELEDGLFWANDIIFSPSLSPEETSQFVWLLKKAQGKLAKRT